jgi:hypothetical protein
MKAILLVLVLLLGAAAVVAAVLGFQNRLTSLPLGRAGAAVTATRGAPASSPAAPPAATAPPAAPRVLLDASGSGGKITQDFTVAGQWDLAWSVDCSKMGQARGFSVTVENGGGVPPRDALQGVIELVETKQATVHNVAAGTFHLNVATDPPCTWRVAVTGPPGPPPPTPSGRTLLDLAGSGQKTTQSFVTGGAWDLFWSYDCTSMGRGRNFGVSVEGLGNATGDGAIQLGEREAGMVHNQNPGTFQLKVDADQQCTWRVTVTG